jgi:DNA transformation protein
MSSEYVELLKDLSRPIPGIGFRRMFGADCMFHDGLMFAILHEERLYLKVDEDTRGLFDEEGLPPFTYPHKDGTTGTLSGYRLAPERLYDEGDEFCDWARRAIAVAHRAAEKKVAKPRKKNIRTKG